MEGWAKAGLFRACEPDSGQAHACRHIITSDVLCQLSYVGPR